MTSTRAERSRRIRATQRRRVVGYVRISRESDESSSVEKQSDIIRRTAAAMDVELVDIIVDVGQSASKKRLDRPGLTRVREMLANGLADAVLVWKLDRLVRSVVDFSELLDSGVDVISCTEPLDTDTPMGRAMAEVLQVFAALESRTIGARIKDTRAYLARSLRWTGGRVPYGYHVVPHPEGGKVLEPEPEEREWLRRAADRILGEGPFDSPGSAYEAVEMLNSEGCRPRRSDSWSIKVLKQILTGDAVLGYITTDGKLVRDDDGIAVQAWEAVLPHGTVMRLRERLAPKRLTVPNRRRPTRIVSGHLRCGSCRGELRLTGRRSASRYGCTARPGTCECAVYIDADKADTFIEQRFLDEFGDMLIGRDEIVAQADPELDQVREAIVSVTRDMTETSDDGEAEKAFRQVQALKRRRDELESAPPATQRVLVEEGTVRERWPEWSVARRAEEIRYSVDPIVVLPGEGRKRFDPDRILFNEAMRDETREALERQAGMTHAFEVHGMPE